MGESSLLQAVQDNGQTHVALLEIGNSGHDLLVSGVAACLLQLNGQIGQFSGVGSVVADHVVHQSHQLIHGGVLAVGAAAVAVAAAIVVVVVVMMRVTVVVGVGMLVIVAAAADMIFVNMHGKFSFNQ